jgi:hypothetical protein
VVEINWEKNEKFQDILKKRLQYVNSIEKIDGFPRTFQELVRYYFPKKTDLELKTFINRDLLNWTFLRPRDLIILTKKIIESE